MDGVALDRLRRLGGKELVVKMIELFSSHVETVLQQAMTSYKLNDLEGVERAAHSMKSSAGNVGAAEFRHLAEQAEDAAHERDVPALQSLLPELEEAFDRAKTRLEEQRRQEN